MPRYNHVPKSNGDTLSADDWNGLGSNLETHDHIASDITDGVLAPERLGAGTPNGTQVLFGDGTWGDPPGGVGVTSHDDLTDVDTDADATAIHHTLGTGPSQAASGNHGHDAAAITSGVIDIARIGTGARNGNRILRDDGVWADPPSAGVNASSIQGVPVDLTGLLTNQILKFDGTQFSPATDATGGSGSGAFVVVTNISEANAAITANNAKTNGGDVIFFAAGTYSMVVAMTTITKPVTLMAQPGTVRLFKTSGSFTILTIRSSYVTIDGLIFDGNYPTIAGSSGNLVTVYSNTTAYLDFLRVKNCQFLNSSDRSLSLATVRWVWIQSNFFDRCYSSHIRCENTGTTNSFYDVWIEDNYFNRASQLVPDAGGDWHGVASILLHGTGNKPRDRFHIKNNTIMGGGIGLGLDAIYRSEVIGNILDGEGNFGEAIAFTGGYNRIQDNLCTNYDGGGILAYMTSGHLSRDSNEIIGNRVHNCYSYGIRIEWATGGVATTIRDMLISGNHVYNEVGVGKESTVGISLMRSGAGTPDWYNCAIINNHMYPNRDYAIFEDASISSFALLKKAVVMANVGNQSYLNQNAATDTTLRNLHRAAVVGYNTYDNKTLKIGSWSLWVDSTGDLRIINGEPTTDTSGTVVGTQS